MEDGDHGWRQDRDGGRASEAAQRKQVHLEEGVPINHGEVSKSQCCVESRMIPFVIINNE